MPVFIDFQHRMTYIKPRYGTGEGNFDIVITNNDIEAAYDEFLAFLKTRYPSLT